MDTRLSPIARKGRDHANPGADPLSSPDSRRNKGMDCAQQAPRRAGEARTRHSLHVAGILAGPSGTAADYGRNVD